MSTLNEWGQVHRPSIQKTLMESAKLWANRSTCERSQVGVVIASVDNRILCTGYNGAPRGMRHCDHTCNCLRYEEPGFLPAGSGKHGHGCNSLKPCTDAVHGEANTIAFAAREGIRLDGGKLYTTLSPCHACAQLVINAGIVSVVYLTEYRDPAGIHLLHKAGLDVVRYAHG